MNTAYESRVPNACLTALAAQTPRSALTPTVPTTWLLDSGANAHITNNPGQLTNAQVYTSSDHVNGVNGGLGLNISHIGTSYLHFPTKSYTLSNTLYCPNAS